MKKESVCNCGVPIEIHHPTACGWIYACIPFLPFEKINVNMTIEEKQERWKKWNEFWNQFNKTNP